MNSGINYLKIKIMKKTILLLSALACLTVACNKELTEAVSSSEIRTLSAQIDNGTRTTYTEDGVFSWTSGDIISYVVRSTEGSSPTNKYDRYQYSTSGSGTQVSFTGAVPSGQWSSADFAYYPYNGDSANGYSSNTFDVGKNTTLQAILYGTIKAYPDRLKGIIPMIGVKTGTNSDGSVENYHFYPVTGVLKVSFAGLPSAATQLALNSTSAYPLYGTFNVDTGRSVPEIKSTDVASGYAEKYLNFDYSSSSDSFYIPLPTGTIPAGTLTVSINDGTNTLYAVTNKQDIVLTRGEITELPTITVPSVKVKFSGAADNPKATIYFSGDVAYVKYSSTMTTDYGPGNTCSASGSVIDLSKGYNYKWPFQYQAYNSADEAIGSLQIEYYYSITSTGINEVCKQFTSANSDIGLSDSHVPTLHSLDPFPATTPTISFAVSDDATKGNIMVTEFCGISGKVYGTYVDYKTASSTPKQGLPQIVTNNEVFCSAGGNDYILKEASYAGARFGVKTTVYGTPNVYGKDADLVCWGASVGLYSSTAGWGTYVDYFFDPVE